VFSGGETAHRQHHRRTLLDNLRRRPKRTACTPARRSPPALARQPLPTDAMAPRERSLRLGRDGPLRSPSANAKVNVTDEHEGCTLPLRFPPSLRPRYQPRQVHIREALPPPLALVRVPRPTCNRKREPEPTPQPTGRGVNSCAKSTTPTTPSDRNHSHFRQSRFDGMRVLWYYWVIGRTAPQRVGAQGRRVRLPPLPRRRRRGPQSTGPARADRPT